MSLIPSNFQHNCFFSLFFFLLIYFILTRFSYNTNNIIKLILIFEIKSRDLTSIAKTEWSLFSNNSIQFQTFTSSIRWSDYYWVIMENHKKKINKQKGTKTWGKISRKFERTMCIDNMKKNAHQKMYFFAMTFAFWPSFINSTWLLIQVENDWLLSQLFICSAIGTVWCSNS